MDRVTQQACPKTAGGDGGAAYAGIAGVPEIGVVQGVEGFGAEYHADAFRDGEALGKSGIEVPVWRSLKDIAAETEFTRIRDHKGIGVGEEDGADHAGLRLEFSDRQRDSGLEGGTAIGRWSWR